MSIRPFSFKEIENLKEVFKEYGWQIEGLIENNYRYSLKKSKIVILTLKFPVKLPIKLNIPFEIACFRLSVAFQFWNLNQNITAYLSYVLKALKRLASQIEIEHQFPIKGKEKSLLKILNLLIPDLINKENERAWLNRIRISLMNKREEFEHTDYEIIKKIVPHLEKAGLNATFQHPWELKKGLPKLRTSETLFFSNEEPFDEFFIVEKGYYSYFKDLEYNKCYVRTFFEIYIPYILNTLFGDNPEFEYESYIKEWIKFARLLLNSLIEILDTIEINQNEFIQFLPQRELDSEDDFVEEKNNFPFTALHYEANIAKELFSIHNDLLNQPPIDFEVIENINVYTEAENLIQNYKFEKATEILNEALKIFNKYKQRKVVVSILLLLRKVASLLNQPSKAINYLQSALGVAKSGNIPVDFIIRIHHRLGKIYFDLDNIDQAYQHFQIVLTFLEKEDIQFGRKSYFLGMAYLYCGLIAYERKKVADSKKYFKNAIHTGENSPRVKLYYYLKRGTQLKNKGKVSQAYKILKSGLNGIEDLEVEEKDMVVLVDLLLELAEFMIYQKKDAKRAMSFLKQLSEMISIKSIEGIHRAIRWNLLMSDFYNFLVKNREKNSLYMKKAQKLKVRLSEIGVKL